MPMRLAAISIAVLGVALASQSWIRFGDVLAAPVDSDRPQLLKVREEAWRAWFTNNQDRMKTMFPADTIAINAGQEKWDGRKETLESAQKFAADGGRLVKLEFPRTEMQLYDNVAVLYSLYRVETEVAGKPSVQEGRATEVFVRRNGQWVNPGWHTDSGK